jgi:acetylglutamate kinase
MLETLKKAQILSEALPYIRRFSGKTFVIKYGGSAMVNPELKDSFASDITLLKYIGINPVIVHGGGPQIGEKLALMGIQSEFKDGLRVTNSQTMEVVEMVLVGRINKEIVCSINAHGGRAVGLSGKDGNLIVAEKHLVSTRGGKNPKLPPEIIDLGMVGKVKKINPEAIEALMKENFIPIIAPVGVGDNSESYNINADTVTAEIAIALHAEKMILLTDVEGIKNGQGKLVTNLSSKQVKKMIQDEVITGGMIPKVESCMQTTAAGVQRAHIIDGRVMHSLLLEIFTDSGIGTVINGKS